MFKLGQLVIIKANPSLPSEQLNSAAIELKNGTFYTRELPKGTILQINEMSEEKNFISVSGPRIGYTGCSWIEDHHLVLVQRLKRRRT